MSIPKGRSSTILETADSLVCAVRAFLRRALRRLSVTWMSLPVTIRKTACVRGLHSEHDACFDDPMYGLPAHFYTYRCRHCGEEFEI